MKYKGHEDLFKKYMLIQTCTSKNMRKTLRINAEIVQFSIFKNFPVFLEILFLEKGKFFPA